MNRLAAQMYTLRDLVKTAEGLDAALQTLHAIGYAGVQLSAVGCMDGDEPEVSPERARTMLDDHGLVCVGTHRPFDRLEARTDDEIARHRTLGTENVGIGGWFSEDWDGFLARAEPVAARLRSGGTRFLYHNHAHEWAPDPATGRPAIERLLEQEWLAFIPDTYWIQHAGPDVAGFLRRLEGRMPLVHLKDKTVVAGEGPTYAPVGEGYFDWSPILDACAEAGAEWYVVEQDVCRRDPFDCLASSFDFLAARGLAG